MASAQQHDCRMKLLQQAINVIKAIFKRTVEEDAINLELQGLVKAGAMEWLDDQN